MKKSNTSSITRSQIQDGQMTYTQKADTNGKPTTTHQRPEHVIITAHLLNMKITVLKIRMSGDEDDVYVFENWHEKSTLQPFIKNWCKDYDLSYEDQNETWFYDSWQTSTDNHQLSCTT